MKMRYAAVALGIAGAVLAAAQAGAAEYEVKMLNKGPDGRSMVFAPAFLEIEAGDTVTFVPTDKGHNAEIIKGMLPDDAEAWKGKMNREVTVTFGRDGVYGYKCLPHYGLGMVGLIKVGDDAANVEAAREVKHPGKAKQAFAALFEQFDTVRNAMR